MLLDIVFFGVRKPPGCTIRHLTGDKSGGTTIPQVAAVARGSYGVVLEQHVGSNVARPSYAWGQLKRGRAFILQGNTHPLLSTQFRSTRGDVDHAVTVMRGRGWKKTTSGWRPSEALVADPAADHHYPWIDQGPSWWPVWLVEQFAAALRPYGADDPRTLGGGKFYCAFAPPPRVDLNYGGQPTHPFPDHQKIKSPVAGRSANVRSRPSIDKKYVVDQIPDGKMFVAYQRAVGPVPAGSKSSAWFGDWTGTRWVHASNLRAIGGDV